MMLIARLDLFRSKLLKETLKVSFFKNLFLSRPQRLLALGLLALGFYFFVCSFFPMWVLLIGPMIWGVPHLISSLRFSRLSFQVTEQKAFLYFQGFVWFCVFSYRVATDLFHLPLWLSSEPLLFEGLCLLISFLFQIYLARRPQKTSVLSFVLFAGLILCTHFFPIETSLVLLIGHNYVPLAFWFKSCQNDADVKSFWIVTGVYVLLSLANYFGAMDLVYKSFSPQGSIAFLNWDYSDVISGFGATPEQYQTWFHLVVLYAFSQSIHYFLWLKAIPENYQPHLFPQSFQWSFKQLSNDFGSSSLYFLFLLVGLGLAYWFVLEFQTARVLYFSIASYHGFMEISNLPFLKSNRRR